MQPHQHHIHQDGGDDRLQDSDDDGAAANGFKLRQPEFVAHGKGNKAQRGLGDDAEVFHLIQRVKAQTGNLQRADKERPKQQSRHQISRNGGQMQQPGQAGHHQTAHQRNGHTNERNFHKQTPSFPKQNT